MAIDLNHTPPRRRASRGFTLLEVLVAMTIFTVLASALYATFSTAMRAYEVGMESGEILQIGRFSIDTVARDIKSVYYRNETSYNILHNSQKEVIRERLDEASEHVVDQDEIREMIDEFNLYFPGLDLGFRGGPSEMSFVRRQIQVGVRPLQPMRLARVRYYVEDRELLREETDVFLMPLDYSGEEVVPAAPRPEVIIENVEELSFAYGFYYDGEWLEAEDWNSADRDKRVDKMEILPYDPLMEQFQYDMQQIVERQPNDQLPSYVRMRLVIKDPDKNRTRTFFRTINVPNAAETHIPLPEDFTLNDEEGESHRFLKSDFYLEPDAEKRGKPHDMISVEERPRLSGGRGW